VKTRYYVESDGRIFLVRREGILDLPHASEIPFDVERVAPLRTSDPVWFCVPRLDAHPHEWPSKDDIPRLQDATDLVHDAVHATMQRVVVEGVCLREGRILLVKGNRGLTDGLWTLPGGFLRFGESPRAGVLRELREEVGVDGRVGELIDVRSKLGEHTRLHWIMLFYRVHIDGNPVANPDEIAEVRFVELDQASTFVSDEAMCSAIEAIVSSARSSDLAQNS